MQLLKNFFIFTASSFSLLIVSSSLFFNKFNKDNELNFSVKEERSNVLLSKLIVTNKKLENLYSEIKDLEENFLNTSQKIEASKQKRETAETTKLANQERISKLETQIQKHEETVKILKKHGSISSEKSNLICKTEENKCNLQEKIQKLDTDSEEKTELEKESQKIQKILKSYLESKHSLATRINKNIDEKKEKIDKKNRSQELLKQSQQNIQKINELIEKLMKETSQHKSLLDSLKSIQSKLKSELEDDISLLEGKK